MKPNGKFALRIAVFAVCALSLLRGAPASAESVRGNFKVTSEMHWGRLLLSPGEYEFTMNKGGSGFMVMVRSRDTGWSGMVLAEAASDARPGEGAKLIVISSRGGLYVRQLSLPDSGVALDYPMMAGGKLLHLARTPPLAIASASGAR